MQPLRRVLQGAPCFVGPRRVSQYALCSTGCPVFPMVPHVQQGAPCSARLCRVPQSAPCAALCPVFCRVSHVPQGPTTFHMVPCVPAQCPVFHRVSHVLHGPTTFHMVPRVPHSAPCSAQCPVFRTVPRVPPARTIISHARVSCKISYNICLHLVCMEMNTLNCLLCK